MEEFDCEFTIFKERAIMRVGYLPKLFKIIKIFYKYQTKLFKLRIIFSIKKLHYNWYTRCIWCLESKPLLVHFKLRYYDLQNNVIKIQLSERVLA